METTIVYWGYIEIMEKRMETTIVYWGHIGIVENEMGTTMLILWRLMALRLLINDGTSRLLGGSNYL